MKRAIVVLTLAVSLGLMPLTGAAQTRAQRPRSATAPLPERAIRRDIPLTNMIRRAFATGTRDSSGRPGRNYWQVWTEYTIDARLDPATSTMTGRERVVIHNRGDSAMQSVVLRLDQNIFVPNVPRAQAVPDLTDGMKLTRLVVNDRAVDLTDPQSAAAFGLTVVRIPLPTPIAGKGSGTLEIEWNFRVPRGSLRMGRWGDTLYQVAQWYPRVAVFDDLRPGWNTDPYLGPSEFYNNFGRFEVRLDLPAGWLVGASGVLQNPEQVLTPVARERLSHVLESDSVRTIVSANEVGPGQATAAGERLIWHFVADTVSDVAWAASNRFVWSATRATIPDRGPIPIHLLYLPGHADRYAGAGQVGRHALEFYSKLWMPYPFPQLTMADGPESGMEYPMFIMSAIGAADHEAGHQWWPMTVGVNETWYGFMDEGFNQYMNLLSQSDELHQTPNLDGLGQRYGQSSGNEWEPPMMWNANYGGPLYSFQVYRKAPLMLSMLGGIVGDSAVWRAMSAYAKAWRFKHPSPWDYAFFMNSALGQDLGWFWYAWLFTTDGVDGSIQRVTPQGRRTAVTVRQDGQMPSPVVLKVQFASRGLPITPMRNSTMVDSVTAIVTYPVDVWFRGSRTFTATLDFGGRKVEAITLDPRGRFPDRDVSDNVWPRQNTAAAP